MVECNFCGKSTTSSKGLCERCELSVFLIVDTLELYLEQDPPPPWVENALRELAWIYGRYTRVWGHFNTLAEVAERFAIEKLDEFDLDELEEINFSRLPKQDILGLLERSQLIILDGNKIKPGLISKKLQKIRWEGYEMNDPRTMSKVLEMYGVVTITLTRAMLSSGDIFPQKALSVFHLISEHILNCPDEIEKVMHSFRQELAFDQLPIRQIRTMKREMTGFTTISPGRTYLINDVDIDGNIYWKNSMVAYMERERERFRERDRERNYLR